MKIFKLYSFLIAILLLSSTVNAQDEVKNELPTKERMSLVEVQGTVTSIVKETREITLIGERGEIESFVADSAIERFDEIVVGDVITVEYGAYMMAEFRAPTEEEIAAPIVILEEGGRASEDMDPGAAVGAIVKAVVTIEAINRPYMMVVVQGPLGNFLTIDVEDRDILEKIHIGQVIILTYAEAIAITLTHAAASE
jgi:hypothetical protein